MVGQDLLDAVNARLGGYQNVTDSGSLLSFLNEGKDELWAILKSLNENYFHVMSQASDVKLDFYFGPLNTGAREYPLPADFREIHYIECTTPGYEGVTFTYRDPTNEEFRSQRKGSTGNPSAGSSGGEYLYTILGKNQFVLGSFPPAALTLTLWYTRSLPDFEPGSTIDEILLPYAKKIADYAAKKTMLSAQDDQQFVLWTNEWKSDVITLAQSASPRNQADPTYVQDFLG